MSKFKVGDIVKVVGRVGIMNMFPTGTVGKVLEADGNPLVQSLYPIWCNERSVQYVSDCDLELISNSKARSSKSLWKVVISSAGDETTARFYEDGKCPMTATVRRYHKDKYDTFIAADEAVKKLFGKQDKPIEQTKPEKPKGFTGRAVYTGTLMGSGFTAGKIYKFDNGRTFDDNGEVRPAPQSRIEPTNLEPGQWGCKTFVKIIE